MPENARKDAEAYDAAIANALQAPRAPVAPSPFSPWRGSEPARAPVEQAGPPPPAPPPPAAAAAPPPASPAPVDLSHLDASQWEAYQRAQMKRASGMGTVGDDAYVAAARQPPPPPPPAPPRDLSGMSAKDWEDYKRASDRIASGTGTSADRAFVATLRQEQEQAQLQALAAAKGPPMGTVSRAPSSFSTFGRRRQ